MSKKRWIALMLACGICLHPPMELIARETKQSHFTFSSITSRIKELGREVVQWCHYRLYPKETKKKGDPFAASLMVEDNNVELSKKNNTTRAKRYRPAKKD